MSVLLLALAGGLGAVTRFVLDGLIAAARAWRYPAGTTTINLSGSLLLGLVAGLVAGHALGGDGSLVLGTGFLGGVTTFSTAVFEVVRLVEQRRWGAVLAHGLGQLVGATALAALGYALGAALG